LKLLPQIYTFNMKLAVEILLGPNRHVSCIAHTLNLVPIEALKSVPEIMLLINKVKSIVTFCNKPHRDAQGGAELSAGQRPP